jgi:hypothetical protein
MPTATKANTKRKSKLIGYVGVDSGQLLVCDPCYIESEWKRQSHALDLASPPNGEFSYEGCCRATVHGDRAGQLNYSRGHEGAGVVFASGYGDGQYPVYATFNDEGRVIKVEIEMG